MRTATRTIIAALLAIFSVSPAMSQPIPALPVPTFAPQKETIALPAPTSSSEPEQWEFFFEQTMVRNVTMPMLYPIMPKNGRGNGKAIIVIPGGGYQFVSMDSEGFRVAERLSAAGYTVFILKYRTMPNSRDPQQFMVEMSKLFGGLGKGELADNPPAVTDLANAISLVESRAAEWNIDPEKIGVIGFSAGARTVIRLLEQKPEAAILDHAGLIYPPMTQTVTGGPRPELFMAIAADDPLFRQGGLNMLSEWLKQSWKVEFHLYSGGNHGFGMRPQGTTSDYWIDDYIAWLALS